MQTKLAQATTVATLLLNSASAVTDHPDGLGGDAPCLESYLGMFNWNDVGGDPHAVHGLLANDKSYVAVGAGYENADLSGSG